MFKPGDKVYSCLKQYRNLEVVKTDKIYTYCKGEEFSRATRDKSEGWYQLEEKRFLNITLKKDEFKNEKKYNQKNKWDKIANRNILNTSVRYLYEQLLHEDLDLNPFYQRDLVWTGEQKKAYIEALFLNKAVITPTIILNWKSDTNKLGYEVLDGKQRISTIFEFIENKFSIFDNIYFKDLSQDDAVFILRHDVEYTRIEKINCTNFTDEEKVELFLEINELGTKMSDEHIKKVKELLK